MVKRQIQWHGEKTANQYGVQDLFLAAAAKDCGMQPQNNYTHLRPYHNKAAVHGWSVSQSQYHLALIYLVNRGPFWTGSGQATVPAVPASIVGAWLSLTCVNADSGWRWRTSSTTARRQSLPAGWRLFMRLMTMPSIGFRIRRRKHSWNEWNSIMVHAYEPHWLAA